MNEEGNKTVFFPSFSLETYTHISEYIEKTKIKEERNKNRTRLPTRFMYAHMLICSNHNIIYNLNSARDEI